MKKYFFVITILSILILTTFIPYSYGYEDKVTTINLASYLEENNITNVKKICSDEFCDYLRSVNLTKSISIYEEKCEKYWQEKIGFQKAYEMKIKGFPITDIVLMGE